MDGMYSFRAPKRGQTGSRPGTMADDRCLMKSGDIKGGSAPSGSKMRSSREYPAGKGHDTSGRLFQRQDNQYAVGGVNKG